MTVIVYNVSHPIPTSYQIIGNPSKTVRYYNYLGIVVSSDLKWDKLVEETAAIVLHTTSNWHHA